MDVFRIFIPIWSPSSEFIDFIWSEGWFATYYYHESIVQVGFSSWIFIRLSWIKYHNWRRATLGFYVMKNSLSMDDWMSVDMVTGEWRMTGLLTMDFGGSVLCLYLFSHFSTCRGCGFGFIFLSGTYGWYLVRFTDLGCCGWKWSELWIYICNGLFKSEMRGTC